MRLITVSSICSQTAARICAALALPPRERQTELTPHLQVDTRDLWPNVGILLGAIAAYVAVIAGAHWRTTRCGGCVLIASYGAYVMWQILSVWVFDLFENRDAS